MRRSLVTWSVLALGACGSDGRQAGEPDVDAAIDAAFPDTPGDDGADGTDATAPDEEPDARAEVEPEPGGFGAPCVGNGDCDSGWCIEADAGFVCTDVCIDACPEGWSCHGVAFGTDVAFICEPDFAELCEPCDSDLDCGRGVCIGLDGGGGCASPCVPNDEVEPCEAGFQCQADPGREGAFCQPVTRSCTCSARSSAGERACSVTIGDFRCSGVEACDPAVGWGACSAATPSDEDCNGRDDDCNGAVDDALVFGACMNDVGGVGSCPGVDACNGTLGWVCDGPTPRPEVCDGADSDCDGLTDEDFRDAAGAFSLATACGRCGNDCTTRYANGVGRCGAGVDPTGADRECEVDHCDPDFVLFGGQCVPPIDTTCQVCADDGDCLGGSCLSLEGEGGTVCLMPCADGACEQGLSCRTFGALERCAPTSGSCACTPALAGNQRTCSIENAAGRCLGLETCEDSAWSACSARTPLAEACNGDDDDCDGEIDQGALWEDRGTTCTVGLGACAATGVRRCDPAAPHGPTVCSVAPGASSDETCNGIDDDCDGTPDDVAALPACALQAGVCAGSKQACGGAAGFLACPPATYGADYEVDEASCDGADNDCDGASDEVDADGDQHVADACAGNDCDDSDPQVFDGATEIWDAKDNDCNGVVDEGVIPPGTVIVTELMHQPGPQTGEYFEVTNLGQSAVDLASWRISDTGGESFVVTTSVRIDPGQGAVLCREGAGLAGGTCAFLYGAALTLDDDDEVILALAGVEIDRVAYGAAFPAGSGRALNLDPAQYSFGANDVAGNWCTTAAVAANLMPGGGYGSPGRVNPSCSGGPAVVGVSPASGIEHGGDMLVISGSGFVATTAVSVGGAACQGGYVIVNDNAIRCVAPAHAPGFVAVSVTKGGALGTLANGYRYTGEDVAVITWVDLQWPKTITVDAGETSELVFGQVRAQGITEPLGEPAGILGQVGYGPKDSDPRLTPGWVWLDATWNKQFYDNDEYMRSLVIPAPGVYSYTYRFSDDGGTSFMYGDYDPGTADGLSPTNLGTVTVH